jgi:hypothetical protein
LAWVAIDKTCQERHLDPRMSSSFLVEIPSHWADYGL